MSAPRSPAEVLTQLRELLGLEGGGSWPDLQRLTHRQLLDCAERLGLTDLHRLTTAAIAAQFQQALRRLGLAEDAREESPQSEPSADRAHKFDLGRGAEREPEPEHIPWGYGQDRVTAMVVDPERLFIYWEVTDEAIERARAGLGAGAHEAWLNLRVYDVTGRIFDGTNAHRHVDHRVTRTDRQWFLEVGKPASTACVEIGLKSGEGYFVRIARSGRADFPRREPVASGEIEWLTVRTASGAVEETVPGGSVAAGPPPRSADGDHRVSDHGRDAREESAWEWEEVSQREWSIFPLEAPSRVEERFTGTPSIRSEGGRSYVVSGPWEVVIRGLGGRAERRILARWEIHRSWPTRGGVVERAPGEQAMAPGASERLAGSEVRLGGASEVRFLAASERRLRGASELRLGGASERRPGVRAR